MIRKGRREVSRGITGTLNPKIRTKTANKVKTDPLKGFPDIHAKTATDIKGKLIKIPVVLWVATTLKNNRMKKMRITTCHIMATKEY
ncbi:MAG: hypothetical protein P8Y00_01880 [Deltaproteobacteria bacterium]|jgi:hypothetical protein